MYQYNFLPQVGTKASVCVMERGGGSSPSVPNQSRARPPSSATCRGWTACRGWRLMCEHGRVKPQRTFIFFLSSCKRDPFDTPVTHTNKFSNSISDLPAGASGTPVWAVLLLDAAWIKLKTSCSAASKQSLNSKDCEEQTQRKNRDFLNYRPVPVWVGWLSSRTCHNH